MIKRMTRVLLYPSWRSRTDPGGCEFEFEFEWLDEIILFQYYLSNVRVHLVPIMLMFILFSIEAAVLSSLQFLFFLGLRLNHKI